MTEDEYYKLRRGDLIINSDNVIYKVIWPASEGRWRVYNVHIIKQGHMYIETELTTGKAIAYFKVLH